MTTLSATHPTGTRSAFDPSVLYGVLALAVMSGVGAVIAVSGNLSADLLDALGPQGRLSIPLPMIAFQVLMAIIAGSGRRVPAMVASGLLSLAVLAGVISGFFDGGYADERLTTFQRGYQIVFIAALVAVGVLATRRFVQLARTGSGDPRTSTR